MDGAVSLTEKFLDASEGFLDTFTKLGVGIASIFLLVVIFVYVSNILDGGKFQVKMLLPLLIYLAVCNYKYVAGPIVNFGLVLQREAVGACLAARGKVLQAEDKKTILGAFWARGVEGTPLEEKISGAVDYEEPEDSGVTVEDGSSDKKKTGFLVGIGQNIAHALHWFGEQAKKFLVGLFTTEKPGKVLAYGAMGLIAELFDLIAQMLEVALTCLGALMTGVVVVFGPITWAFAVWPGNQRTLAAWAIRICQFMLYSPITAIISTFTISTVLSLMDTLFSGSGLGALGPLLGVVGFLLAEIAAFMSVPAIASMIIEGAQGAVTLSQGIMTASSIVQMGEAGRDTRMQSSLDKLGNGGGSGGPSPSSSGGLTGGVK